jgi:hypothetical protein
MGKTILKGLAGLFLAFCVGMTAIALWRALVETSGDAATSLVINRTEADVYAMVTDPASFAEWTGWHRRDRKAVFAVHGTDERPTVCWSGPALGSGCATRGPADPERRAVRFSLSRAATRNGVPEPATPTLEEYQGRDGLGVYRLTIAPVPRGSTVTLVYEQPPQTGVVARFFALLAHGEEERRAADMLASLRTKLRRA